MVLTSRSGPIPVPDKAVELKAKLETELKTLWEGQYNQLKNKKEQHTTEVEYHTILHIIICCTAYVLYALTKQNHLSLKNVQDQLRLLMITFTWTIHISSSHAFTLVTL